MESKVIFRGDSSSVTKSLEQIKSQSSAVGKALTKNVAGGLTSVTSSLSNIQSISADASTSLASMGGNLAKLGPVGAIAGAAIASIGAGIANSQQLTDLFAQKWEQIKSLLGVVGKAFGDLIQGNFKEAFNTITNGFSQAWSSAGEYATALDNLGTNTITWQQQQARLNRDMAEQEAIIRDTTKTEKERINAQRELKRLQTEYIADANKQQALEQAVADAYIAKLLAESGQAKNFNEEEKRRLKDYLTAVDGTIDDLSAKGGKWADVFDKISDSEYQQFATYYSSAQATSQQVEQVIKSTNKLIQTSIKSVTAEATTATTQYAEGSVGAIKAKIAELEKAQLNLKFGSAEWENIEKIKKDLQDSITAQTSDPITVPVTFDEGTIGAIKQKIAELNKELENTVYASDAYNALKQQIDELNASITQTTQATTQVGDNAQSAFAAAGASLGAFAEESEEAATAQRALAIAEQLAAMASAIHSASGGDPYTVAPRIIATAASVVSAFAMMAKSKFAGGGIIGGNSYAGDTQLIRANSGEMVLNSSQQARLWNTLNTVGAGRAGKQEIFFTLRGSDIKGSLSTTQKTQNRLS